MSVLTFHPPFTIAGQAGKLFGPVRRQLSASGAEAATLTLMSMDADQLALTTRGVEFSWMEEVSLWDSTGRRIFWGNVTTCDPEWLGGGRQTIFRTTVSGPWWWLEHAQLSALATDTADTTQDRPEFIFIQQDLAVSIRALIDRMRELGVPLRCGTIDPTYAVPQMVFQSVDPSSALRTMLGWLPDAATRVRYDSGGLPEIDILRRPASGGGIIYDLADPNRPLADEQIRLRQRRELRPLSVAVQSARCNPSSGEIEFDEQTAGEPETAGVIGRQLLAISGPGRAGWSDVDVRRYLLKTSASIAVAVEARNTQLAALAAEMGGSHPYVAQTATISWWVGGTYYWLNPFSTIVFEGQPAAGIPSGFPANMVLGEPVPDWWSATKMDTRKARATSRYVAVMPPGSPWNAAVAGLSFLSFNDGTNNVYFADIESDLDVVSQAATGVGTLIIHPDDQAFVQPLPSLAANLYAAQNYIPFDGTLPLIPWADLPLPASAISLRGARPEWRDMRAMVSESSIDLVTGIGSVSVGSARRETSRALSDRFQRPTSQKTLRL